MSDNAVAAFRRSGLVLVAALTLFASAASAQSRAESFRPFKLKTLDGVERTLADVLGSKATLVAFFFPSCPYCNGAFPHVQRIYDANKDHGLSVVWINVLPEEQKLIAPWRDKHGYTVPVLLGTRGTPNQYKVMMTPTHYLLDAKGQVVSMKAGFRAGDEQALEQEIATLLR